MKNKMMAATVVLLVLATLATVASFFLPTGPRGGARRAAPAGGPLAGVSVADFPDEGLVNQEGEAVSFESLPEKPVLITFIYTRCPMPKMCPLVAQNVREVQKRLSREGEDPARFVVISFDPEYDTPAVLKEYGKRYDVDYDNWAFWTGDPETISKLIDRFHIRATRGEGGKIVHNMRLYLLDGEKVVRDSKRGSFWSPEKVAARLGQLAG